MKEFIEELRVRTYELDSFGHVNNAVYLNYFEVARFRLLAQLGVSIERLGETGKMFVMSEAALKFKSPARYDDLLLIRTTFTIRKIRILFNQIIENKATRQLIATATITAVLVDQNGRPIDIPEPLKRLMSKHADTKTGGTE